MGTTMNTAQAVIQTDGTQDTGAGDGLPLQESAANEASIKTGARVMPAFGGGLKTAIWYLLVLFVLYLGWQRRGNVYITPEEGAGYALGIIGGSMMLLLLLYPLRKHLGWMRILGPVSYWFRAHMLMGILGPVCILYHCNYQLGSTNGNVALFSMLLVAASGVVGRYFYTKIHYGLYGAKTDLARLANDRAVAMSSMGRVLDMCPALAARLKCLEKQAAAPVRGIIRGMARVLVIGIRARWCWITSGPGLRRAVGRAAGLEELPGSQQRKLYRHARYHLGCYLQALRRLAGLAFYERLFSLWHVLHLPLFIMLLISGFVHVYAVHMY